MACRVTTRIACLILAASPLFGAPEAFAAGAPRAAAGVVAPMPPPLGRGGIGPWRAPADGAASVLAEELDAGKAAASPPPRENFHQFRFVTKPNPNDEARNDAAAPAETSEIALTWYRGTLVAPASINGAPKLDFIVDSGAADVSITADALETLIKSGAVTDADFLGKKTYKLADGSTVPSQIFRIHSLRVGDREVDNVLAAVNAADGGMLLGQSFLGRLKSWSIDNERRRLLLK